MENDGDYPYPCRHCGRGYMSRAGRLYHENICVQNPKNEGMHDQPNQPRTEHPEPKEEPPAIKTDDIESNKENFEREYGVEIPDTTGDEPTPDPTFDGENPEIPIIIIWVVCFIGILAAGWFVFRDKIGEMLNRRPPRPVAADLGFV